MTDSLRSGHNAVMTASQTPPPGVGTASLKLVERPAGSPTGAWRPGDDPGHRRFLEIGDLPLESGEVLPDTHLAFETWGELNAARDNAVLVLHALTGDSHVTGEAGPGHPTPGWWSELVGPGRAIDTERYYVVAANILGGCQGSTGPSSTAPDGRPWGSRFPWLTTRDAVEAETRLADALGIETFHLAIGASLGGHRAIEWAVSHPGRVRNLALVATGASTTADQLAWCHLQELAIVADPYFFDGDYYSHVVGPVRGLGLARAIAHTTYRSATEFDTRFGRAHQGEEDPAVGGRYQVESYLDYHANKLLARFDANSYLIVTHSMMVHDVGIRRGGTEEALSTVTARTLVVDVDSDRLFPAEQAEQLARCIPSARRATIHSLHGHDGFLIEADQMDAILRDFLAEAEADAGGTEG
ncbi:Homoserine O-acetyltransferase [Actinomyces howellii]|uniref:Homoserine O-acetyltransferase n=2 Tax=Actinomyces howellii TaxID=52771 RepID=A0A3S4UX93_9ACTO|nr:Homoserine O-acetyltransferase [Actinomyces howellii]